MRLDSPFLQILCGAFYIPKDNPSKPDGEDAHFYCEEAQVIGVADGVGGWAERGIDAGEYARQLMKNAYNAVKGCRPYAVNPSKVMDYAHSMTDAKGSSTACIISTYGGLLFASNLGDSGFLVIREGKTCYRSPVQQYGFNAPYQMGKRCGDGPEAAEDIVVGMKKDDVIVAGTDGLFDNLFQEDIEEIVGCCMKEERRPPPAVVAEKLANTAWEKAVRNNIVTPFEMAAFEAGVEHFGGKYDDITVVVAYTVCDRLPVEKDAEREDSRRPQCTVRKRFREEDDEEESWTVLV